MCCLLLVTSPLFLVVWCGWFLFWVVCRGGSVLLSFVCQSAEQCFDVCWFSAVTSRRIVVVLVNIWMFLLFLIDFYSIFCSYLQWIFRKKYAGWRVQNLCVTYWLRMQVLGKYLPPRMNFACFSKILIPSIIGVKNVQRSHMENYYFPQNWALHPNPGVFVYLGATPYVTTFYYVPKPIILL